jgi:hypothetical protein
MGPWEKKAQAHTWAQVSHLSTPPLWNARKLAADFNFHSSGPSILKEKLFLPSLNLTFWHPLDQDFVTIDKLLFYLINVTVVTYVVTFVPLQFLVDRFG